MICITCRQINKLVSNCDKIPRITRTLHSVSRQDARSGITSQPDDIYYILMLAVCHVWLSGPRGNHTLIAYWSVPRGCCCWCWYPASAAVLIRRGHCNCHGKDGRFFYQAWEICIKLSKQDFKIHTMFPAQPSFSQLSHLFP